MTVNQAIKEAAEIYKQLEEQHLVSISPGASVVQAIIEIARFLMEYEDVSH